MMNKRSKLVPKLLCPPGTVQKDSSQAKQLPQEAGSKDDPALHIGHRLPLASHNGQATKPAVLPGSKESSDLPQAVSQKPLLPQPDESKPAVLLPKADAPGGAKQPGFKDGHDIHNVMKMLTDGMGGLVDEEEVKPKRGRGRGKAGKDEEDDNIGLKEKLMKSWDGKTYLERLDMIVGTNQPAAEEPVREEPAYKPIDFTSFKADEEVDDADEQLPDASPSPSPDAGLETSQRTHHHQQPSAAQQPGRALTGGGSAGGAGREKKQNSRRPASRPAATSTAAAQPKASTGSSVGVKRGSREPDDTSTHVAAPANKRRATATAAAAAAHNRKADATPADKARATTSLGADSGSKQPVASAGKDTADGGGGGGRAVSGGAAQPKASKRKLAMPTITEAAPDSIGRKSTGAAATQREALVKQPGVSVAGKGGKAGAGGRQVGQASAGRGRGGAAAARQTGGSKRRLVTGLDEDDDEQEAVGVMDHHHTAAAATTQPPSAAQPLNMQAVEVEAGCAEATGQPALEPPAAAAAADGKPAGKRGGRRTSPPADQPSTDPITLDVASPALGQLQQALDASNAACEELKQQLHHEQAQTKRLQVELDGLRQQQAGQASDAEAEVARLKAELEELRVRLVNADKARQSALKHLTKSF